MLRIRVLGPLEVSDGAGAAVPLGGILLRRLLIRLALDPGRMIPADRLADDLWPSDPPGDAANALQALVSRLRRATGREAVEYGPGGYRLAAAADQVDAAEFEALVTRARAELAGGDPAGAEATLQRALDLWRGPALMDVRDAPFAAAAITRLDELRLAAAEDLLEAGLARGRGAELVPEAEELAAAHPLRERLRGQLMRALYAAGRQADALAVYASTRDLLADQLGVDPSPALAQVHLAILRADPVVPAPVVPAPVVTAAPAAIPALPGSPTTAAPAVPIAPAAPAAAAIPVAAAAPGSYVAPRRVTNLPAQLTSFVGREGELTQVSELLACSRLVTLTGPGGAGKTRLSVEASASQLGHCPDGVWFVPLAPVRDALDVPQAVLAAMGLDVARPADPIEAARIAVMPPLERLAEMLAPRRLTLVLDNCEHVVDTVAELAGRVLAGAPGVRILATSREPLGITGETLCPVPSLALPPLDASPAEAERYSAVRLFADRAAAVRPGFTISAENVGPVTRICRALDGIPLAIELAAARLRALTPGQVADRLDDRFRLLSVGSRTALPQHQTLRAIVDWSWELLDEPERVVLRRLSVFSGGANPDSAEEVCALGGDRSPVIDLIASLADKSLVTVTGDAQVRYRLLETVRAYASERLAEAGEEDAVRAAHATWFLDLAEQAEPELRAHDQIAWLGRLTAEHDNFAAGLRYAVASRNAGLGLRYVAALTWFWMLRDYDAEAAEWAQQVRAITGTTAPPGLTDAFAICQFLTIVSMRDDNGALGSARVRDALLEIVPLTESSKHPLMAMAGPVLAVLTGDEAAAEAGLAALASHPDPWTQAAQRMFTGHLAVNTGDIEKASHHLTGSYDAFRAAGDRWGMVVCLMGLAEVALGRDDPAEAIRVLEEARGYATGDFAGPWGETMAIELGRARVRAGDLAAARADFEQGLAAAVRTGNKDDEVKGYLELSELARREGDPAQARQLVDRALTLAEPIVRRPDMCVVAATAYTRLGCLLELDGDLDGAARWHRKALATLATMDVIMFPSNPTLALVMAGMATLAVAKGEPERAAELLGLAHTLQGFRDGGSLEVERASTAATRAIGGATFDAAYARGRQLGRDDALALAPVS